MSALLASPRRVLLVAAALAMFAACVDVLHDPDLFWHLRLGQWILDHHVVPHHELFSFTAQGNTMVAHEWGSEVLFSLMNRVGGLLLVAVVMGLVAWSGLVALGLRAHARGAGPVAIAVALLLGARAMEPVLGTRPQVITVALVCWTLWVAERHLASPRGGRLLWVVPPVVLVWANLHGGVVLGVAALAAVVVLSAVRRDAPWRRIFEVAAATAVAAGLGCLNPNGPGLYRYVVETSGSERAKPITEWHTPNFGDPSNLGLLILMVSFVLLVALGGRVNLRDLVMSAGGFAAALLAVRNTSLAVALALPAWAAMLQQVIDRVRARRLRDSAPGAAAAARGPAVTAGALIIALALAVDGIGVARAAQDASPAGIATAYPACAASALSGVDGVRMLAPYFHSGYLVDRLWPQGRVFLYGESVSLGTRVFDDYVRILDGGSRATALLSSYGANAVLIGPGGLYDTLIVSSDWQAMVHDPMGLTLFVTPSLAARMREPGSCAV